jgi:alanyl-tRNA synthetase
VIDTGMGFERLVRTLQGKHSNYDTDVFQPIIKEISAITGKKYGEDEKTDIAMRVVSDHIRTIAFSIADGQLPSNAKAGYVIRRILRRAVRYAYTILNRKEAFLYKLIPVLIESMGEAYPELEAQKSLIEKVIIEEEESFLRTLDTGIKLLDKIISDAKATGKTQISGVDAFTLYDTYGFPLDLTELILRENGMTVNNGEFNSEMEKQKARARNAATVEKGDWIVLREGETKFVGYDFTEHEASILRYRPVKQKGGTIFQIVLDKTPFYAEMGGQTGDRGVLTNKAETVDVIDTKNENGLIVHIAKHLPNHPESPVIARVDMDKRRASEANHTATHLLDGALREVLGKHVEQKGSLVSPEGIRFDFSHFQKITDEELRRVERLVNEKIREDLPLQEYRELPIEEARKLGAIALFGEKYGDKVRVVQFGRSVEFCGGVHAASTGRIGMFKIISESSIAAGIRRIEARTGRAVEEMLYDFQDTISTLKNIFQGSSVEIAAKKAIEENSSLKKQIEELIREKAARIKDKLVEQAIEIEGIRVVSTVMPASAALVKDITFGIRAEYPKSTIIVIGSHENGKPMITVSVSDDLTSRFNAGQMVREAAKLIQGGGGGQPHFATAGGKNSEGLHAAVEAVKETVAVTPAS